MARILVIDDDPYIRQFVVDSLSLEGYEVDAAEDGYAGLRALADGGQQCGVAAVQRSDRTAEFDPLRRHGVSREQADTIRAQRILGLPGAVETEFFSTADLADRIAQIA